MNQTRKWAWLALGIGGIILAVVSTRMAVRSDAPEAPAISETDPVEEGDNLLSHDDMEFSNPGSAPGMQIKPPSARTMPPIDLRREDRFGRNDGLRGREWKPRVESKGDGIPDVQDTPPLRLNEPMGIDSNRGKKQAWNDVDPGAGGDGDLGGGGDSNYYVPPSGDADPAFPADDMDMPSPPLPSSDLEGDFGSATGDDSDFGGGSGD